LLALGIYPLETGISTVIITLYLILVLLFWIYLANVEVYSQTSGSIEKPAGTILPVWLEAGYGQTFFSILMDLILITVAYYTSYLLRFGGILGPNFDFFFKSLPIMFACQIFCLYRFGVYQRLWWGSRLGDIFVYVKGVTAGTLMAMIVLLFLYRFQSFSRAVFIIYWGVMLIFISFSRFFFRLLDEWVSRGNQKGKPALIYGAGIGGQMVVREMETNEDLGLLMVGFIDDDSKKKGKKIHGYPVLGCEKQLKAIIEKYKIQAIIVSFRDLGDEKKREVQRLCVRDNFDTVVSRMRLIIEP